MDQASGQQTTQEIVAAFRRDGMSLFLGSAFVTVGVVAAMIAVARRTFDRLLLSLAIAALVYGARLWLQTRLLTLALPGVGFHVIRSVIDYVVPLPIVWFLFEAGFLRRSGRVFAYGFVSILLLLFVATLALGPLPILHQVNNVAVIVSCLFLFMVFVREGTRDLDVIAVRRGLLVFLALVVAENVAGVFHRYNRVEPYGFAVFLGSLGYVAVRQALRQRMQLSELQGELEVAQRIQRSILPAAFPDTESFRVATRYVPMTSVAGDFYDFLLMEERRVGLLIADVSGHGVPAALIASMVKLAAASQHSHVCDPAALLHGMNEVLCGNTQTQFVTAAYVYLNADTRELLYAAAAHPPMLLLRSGEVREVVENGLMLAAFDFATYTTATRALEPGDRVLLYTDGLVEAANAAGEQFGPERLCAALRASAGLPEEEAADAILDSVQRWAAAQDDDLTLLVCGFGRLT